MKNENITKYMTCPRIKNRQNVQLHLCSYTQTNHNRYVDFLHGKIVD